MFRLKLFLFGPPRIELDDKTIELPRRKAKALLAYLALASQTQARDTLATLLWPDSAQNLAALRRQLSELKTALGDSMPLGYEWLTIERASVSLNHHRQLWVDVRSFQDLLAESQSHEHAANEVCSDCLPLLSKAVELQHADFLAGFTLRDSPDFDEWQSFETIRLRQLTDQCRSCASLV